jgi:hypothetical protein
MPYAPHLAAGASADRLRGDIDAGRTGDKVSWSDPATAPLGTDDEAGGATSPPTAIEAARAYENSRPHGDPHSHRSGVGLVWFVAIFGAISALIVAGALFVAGTGG